MSPHSPSINGDEYARTLSADPRLRTLEAQAESQACEIALLRQLGEDLGSWRYRVDSASTQTAHVLQHLNKEIDELKSKIITLTAEDATANRGAVDDLVVQMKGCYTDLQDALGRLHDGNPTLAAKSQTTATTTTTTSVEEVGILARLQDVELKLTTAQALVSTQDSVNDAFQMDLEEIRASVAEARGAAAADVAEVAGEVQALRLGLEVVEQSLEDMDVTDALATLRSRVEDLDAGIEHAADEALSEIAGVKSTVTELRSEVARVEETATVAALCADRAEAAAAVVSEDLAALRRDIRQKEARMMAMATPLASPAVSAPTSPARSTTSIGNIVSDHRLKTAVHTLSDGYRSLHRAMSLMYEEQSEVAGRVTAVGTAAAARAATMNRSQVKKVQALNLSSVTEKKRSVGSFPVLCTSRTLAAAEKDVAVDSGTTANNNNKRKNKKSINVSAVDQVAELKVLVAAQAVDAARQQRRADALEAELAAMKQLLCGLAPPQPAIPTTTTTTTTTPVSSTTPAAVPHQAAHHHQQPQEEAEEEAFSVATTPAVSGDDVDEFFHSELVSARSMVDTPQCVMDSEEDDNDDDVMEEVSLGLELDAVSGHVKVDFGSGGGVPTTTTTTKNNSIQHTSHRCSITRAAKTVVSVVASGSPGEDKIPASW